MIVKKRGYFISFEGGEGAGKTIQVELLAQKLKKAGYDVVVTREPGGTPIGEQIRSITHSKENVDLDPKAESYLMAAARAQHVAQVIEPALEKDYIVVCDRFLDSSTAYQGYGRQLGPERIELLNELAINSTLPDLTLLLDISIEEGLKRRKNSQKPTDRLDLQKEEFYKRVRNGYIQLSQKYASRFVVISALGTVEDISTKIWNVVQKSVTLYYENNK
jgi:dTMP kinase